MSSNVQIWVTLSLHVGVPMQNIKALLINTFEEVKTSIFSTNNDKNIHQNEICICCPEMTRYELDHPIFICSTLKLLCYVLQ